MTEPPPAPPSRTFTPAWLSPADVKAWLRLHNQPDDDDDLIRQVCAATEPYVQRCRPEWWQTDTTGVRQSYAPDAETYQAAIMHAARSYRRRLSPGGIEAYGDTTSFVTRFDPDIDRALRTGPYAPPVVG